MSRVHLVCYIVRNMGKVRKWWKYVKILQRKETFKFTGQNCLESSTWRLCNLPQSIPDHYFKQGAMCMIPCTRNWVFQCILRYWNQFCKLKCTHISKAHARLWGSFEVLWTICGHLEANMKLLAQTHPRQQQVYNLVIEHPQDSAQASRKGQ